MAIYPVVSDISLKTECQSHSDARGSQGFELIHKVIVEPIFSISENFDLLVVLRGMSGDHHYHS